MLGRILIINAPTLFRGVWALIKPLLNPRTQSKIQICSSNYVPDLLQWVEADSLPQWLGGRSAGSLSDDVGPWNDATVLHKLGLLHLHNQRANMAHPGSAPGSAAGAGGAGGSRPASLTGSLAGVPGSGGGLPRSQPPAAAAAEVNGGGPLRQAGSARASADQHHSAALPPLPPGAAADAALASHGSGAFRMRSNVLFDGASAGAGPGSTGGAAPSSAGGAAPASVLSAGRGGRSLVERVRALETAMAAHLGNGGGGGRSGGPFSDAASTFSGRSAAPEGSLLYRIEALEEALEQLSRSPAAAGAARERINGHRRADSGASGTVDPPGCCSCAVM
jgi:hypothetical protein